MKALYFENVISVLTIVLVLGMLAFSVLAIKNGTKVKKWGRWIALFIGVGIAISALSATRDAYMMPNAVFAPMGWQSMVCMIAGGAIALTGFVSIFLKNQNARRHCFTIVSALFLVQVLAIEISRPILLAGGMA